MLHRETHSLVLAGEHRRHRAACAPRTSHLGSPPARGEDGVDESLVGRPEVLDALWRQRLANQAGLAEVRRAQAIAVVQPLQTQIRPGSRGKDMERSP